MIPGPYFDEKPGGFPGNLYFSDYQLFTYSKRFSEWAGANGLRMYTGQIAGYVSDSLFLC